MEGDKNVEGERRIAKRGGKEAVMIIGKKTKTKKKQEKNRSRRKRKKI